MPNLRTSREGSRARCAPSVEQAGLLKLYDEMDLPLVPVLTRMEQAGVKIDTAALSQMSGELEREISTKAKEIYEVAGMEFNVGSPKQLGDVLFNRMNLPKPVKYGKGRTISTAVDVLEELAENHPIARMVLDYRQLTKLKSTYVDALPALINPATGRLHTTFGQTGTATGRLSSANPNLQNIPIRTELGRGIRAAFIAEPGHVLLTADYSQIELRLLAHFSHDALLVEAYRRGDDVHTLTASQVFGVPPLMVTPDHRRQAKVVNFGIVYGLSAFGLSQNLGIEPSEAKQFIAAYFEKYSGVRAFIDKTLEEARRDMKVKTLVRAGASDSRHQQQERQPAWIRRAHGCQHAAARDGSRLDQDCDDPHRRGAARARHEVEDDPSGARRISLRSSGERSRGHAAAGARAHGESSRPSRAPAGGYGRGRELERSGVAPNSLSIDCHSKIVILRPAPFLRAEGSMYAAEDCMGSSLRSG